MSKFVNTRTAAQCIGISEYELRTGFKQGRYPALEIGRGSRRRSLRWDIDLLRKALEERMLAEHDGR